MEFVVCRFHIAHSMIGLFRLLLLIVFDSSLYLLLNPLIFGSNSHKFNSFFVRCYNYIIFELFTIDFSSDVIYNIVSSDMNYS